MGYFRFSFYIKQEALSMKKRPKRSNAKKLFNPNAYVILSILILIAVIMTWIIPAGEYQRYVDEVTGRILIDPESFSYIDNSPVGIFAMLKAIPRGLQESSAIIMFIFIVSGTIQILKSTGALDAGLKMIILRLNGNDTFILCSIAVICSLLGSIFGFAQEIMPLIPLGVSLAVGLGYDRVVGFDIVRTALWVGFVASTLNPFAIGIAHDLSGLPMFSGLGYRIICYVVFMIITLIFIVRYARHVKTDKNNSVLCGYVGEKGDDAFTIDYDCGVEKKHFLVLGILCINFALMVYGTIAFEWGTTDLAALFLGFGILMGFAGGLKPGEVASEFSKGLSSIAFGAIVVGFARAIVLILEDGQVLDTIVYFLSQCIVGAGDAISLVGMFLIQSGINFFIGSATGQAAATMPIMIPLADALEVTRQGAVLSYQFGAGITDMIYPAMVYYLPFADIPYDRWVKHIWKLVVALSAAAVVLLMIAGYMNYGPF